MKQMPMKLLLTFCILTCLSSPLLADCTFIDDAPQGFIHLTYPNRDPTLEPVDVYIPTTNIVEIKIESMMGGFLFEVRIKTNGTTATTEKSSSLFYIIEFKTRAEAMEGAARLMTIAAKDEPQGQLVSLPHSYP